MFCANQGVVDFLQRLDASRRPLGVSTRERRVPPAPQLRSCVGTPSPPTPARSRQAGCHRRVAPHGTWACQARRRRCTASAEPGGPADVVLDVGKPGCRDAVATRDGEVEPVEVEAPGRAGGGVFAVARRELVSAESLRARPVEASCQRQQVQGDVEEGELAALGSGARSVNETVSIRKLCHGCSLVTGCHACQTFERFRSTSVISGPK
jgi:hypothetical protein